MLKMDHYWQRPGILILLKLLLTDGYLSMRENEAAVLGDGFCVYIQFEADEKMGKKTETKMSLTCFIERESQ